MADVDQVLVFAVRFLCGSLYRNAILLGVCEQVSPAFELGEPFGIFPRADDLHLRHGISLTGLQETEPGIPGNRRDMQRIERRNDMPFDQLKPRQKPLRHISFLHVKRHVQGVLPDFLLQVCPAVAAMQQAAVLFVRFSCMKGLSACEFLFGETLSDCLFDDETLLWVGFGPFADGDGAERLHPTERTVALDESIMGCASIIDTFRQLQGQTLSVNITGAFASQEEVGTRGAMVTVQNVKPDIAICFEGCPADDTVVPAYQSQTALKKGPMLRYIDARMITNPRFQRFALHTAQELGIPVQAAVRSGGATDGAPIHIGACGVPVIVIGIPVRYAHTHYGISSFSDYAFGVALATEIIRRLDREVIKGF